MTKVDNLMSEIAGIRAGRKRLLTLNIIRLFNESKSQSKKAPQNLKQNPIRDMSSIEFQLNGLKSDMEIYKLNLKNSRLRFKKFQDLRKANLPF